MHRNWSNWEMGTEGLKEVFEKSIKQSGTVRIFTVLNHVSSSGMSRHISAYVPLIGNDGKPYIACIARERYVSGCGMDMGFHLAYSLYCQSGINDDNKHPYQDCLSHSWL